MPEPLQSGTSRYPIVLGNNGELKKLVPTDDVLEIGELVITLDSGDFTGIVVDGTTNDLTDNSSNPYVLKVYRDINFGTDDMLNAIINDFRLYLKHTAATIPSNIEFYSLRNYIENTGKIVNEDAAVRILYVGSIVGYINDDGEYDSATSSAFRVTEYGVQARVDNDCTFSDSSGTGTTNALFCRGLYSYVTVNPTLSSGSLNVEATGLYIYVNGSTVGNSVSYGIRLANVGGSDSNYGIYDESGQNWHLRSDDQELRIGAGNFDFRLYFDGSTAILKSYSDIFIDPGGNVKFGTHAAISGETLSGYITIKDASGTTRKLAVVS